MADPVDLCAIDDVRAYRQKPDSDTDQDGVVAQLITAASRAINTYCGIDITPIATLAETHVFVYRGGGTLSLAAGRKVAQSVTSVVMDSDTASPSALSSGDWQLRPKPARDGVYRWIRIPGAGTAAFGPHKPGERGTAEREASVTGLFGYPEIPADVRHWAVVTVCEWLDRDVSSFSRTFSLDEARLERPEALPSAVRAGLAHYRQVSAP